mgnify:FL=1
MTLQWSPPESNGGSDVTGYILERKENSDETWTKVVTLDSTVLQYRVENLREKSEFYFRVFAENVVGMSPPATTDLVCLKTHASKLTDRRTYRPTNQTFYLLATTTRVLCGGKIKKRNFFISFSAVPSPPTAPLEIRSIGPNSIIIEWGIPVSDGGSPLKGYTIAIKDKLKTMWMQVGKVNADVQKLTIKDLQVQARQSHSITP